MLDIDDDEHMLLCKTNSTNTGTKTEIKPGAKAFVKEAFEGPKVRELDQRLRKVYQMRYGDSK